VRFGLVGRRATGLLSLDRSRRASLRPIASDGRRPADGAGPHGAEYEPMRDAIRAMRARLPAGTRELGADRAGSAVRSGARRDLAAAPGLLWFRAVTRASTNG